MSHRKYQAALAELERLVVQHLFELTKMGMTGVGIPASDTLLAYKLWEKISKALRTRAEAIHRALQAYNKAADSLNPPRERLSFAEVINKTSLAEFDLLRDTRQDIRDQLWTQPARREAGVLYYGLKRSKEEIVRLNIEMCRLITSMLDEHVDYSRAFLPRLSLIPRLPRFSQNNNFTRLGSAPSICRRLALMSKLTGFSGSLFPGEREGRYPPLADGIRPPFWLKHILGIVLVVVDVEETA
ncbi:hypothetical protein C8R43DRAFT_901458 [Mycena crocata]|nr:hypothetical protein C8R43DRAFT_901458 [Mycena crocata]